MKIICPECIMSVKKCYKCGCEFGGDDRIVCVGIRGKHFCSEECLSDFLMDKFEETHSVVYTYCEEVE